MWKRCLHHFSKIDFGYQFQVFATSLSFSLFVSFYKAKLLCWWLTTYRYIPCVVVAGYQVLFVYNNIFTLDNMLLCVPTFSKHLLQKHMFYIPDRHFFPVVKLELKYPIYLCMIKTCYNRLKFDQHLYQSYYDD